MLQIPRYHTTHFQDQLNTYCRWKRRNHWQLHAKHCTGDQFKNRNVDDNQFSTLYILIVFLKPLTANNLAPSMTGRNRPLNTYTNCCEYYNLRNTKKHQNGENYMYGFTDRDCTDYICKQCHVVFCPSSSWSENVMCKVQITKLLSKLFKLSSVHWLLKEDWTCWKILSVFWDTPTLSRPSCVLSPTVLSHWTNRSIQCVVDVM